MYCGGRTLRVYGIPSALASGGGGGELVKETAAAHVRRAVLADDLEKSTKNHRSTVGTCTGCFFPERFFTISPLPAFNSDTRHVARHCCVPLNLRVCVCVCFGLGFKCCLYHSNHRPVDQERL